jgi:rubrerythrin
MTLYKKGTQDSPITTSSSVYSCTSCDYTEIVAGDKKEDKKCPVCDADMQILSASDDETDEDAV